MGSIYASRVQEYGRGWHRPWLALTLLAAISYWFIKTPNESQVICTPGPDSPWRAAVDIEGLWWTADLSAALECGRVHDRDVLIAFHNVTDANIRANEITVFRNQSVQAAFKRHVLVMMHTDFVPPEFYVKAPDRKRASEDGRKNAEFQRCRLIVDQEPYYVIVRPTGDDRFVVLGAYDEGRITDRRLFVRFLHDPSGYRPRRFWENVRARIRAVIH